MFPSAKRSPFQLARHCLLAAVALGALSLALGGCVYLRLLAIKRQLADFDRHFTLQQADGLRLICRDPVLLSQDFTWMGVVPESKRKLGVAEQWVGGYVSTKLIDITAYLVIILVLALRPNGLFGRAIVERV